ncbi:hypothetical protein [Desulfotruncus arcticus]|uniref:hypothetical protein n=1 Tax=Desulfotruncus arcticus TaxID=341036 RepID=UPI000B821C1B|nr:hypothetical protein [Desulfotruncus arcticus]
MLFLASAGITICPWPGYSRLCGTGKNESWLCIAGYFGGIIDELLMRIVDMIIAFPSIILSIAIIGMWGYPLSISIKEKKKQSTFSTLRIKNFY